jgi:hypothetical protein
MDVVPGLRIFAILVEIVARREHYPRKVIGANAPRLVKDHSEMFPGFEKLPGHASYR